MASAKISDTDFTIGWLGEILQKDIGTKAKITDFSHSEVAYGRGFVSQILIMKLTWDSGSKELPKSVALKIPSSKQLLKAISSLNENESAEHAKEALEFMGDDNLQYIFISKVHQVEVAVYHTFRSLPPKQLKFPKSYLGLEVQRDHQGILVFEDLSDGATVTFLDGLDLDQMFEVAEQIAYLHAYSLTTNAWRNEKINFRFDTMLEGAESLATAEKHAAGALAMLKKEYPDLYDPLADEVLKLCQSIEDISYAYRLNEKLGLPDVLAHGDLHCQNIIFEQPEEGSDKKTGKIRAIVDWQVGHTGNVMEDMVRIFVSSVTSDIRRKHYVDILKHYYESLEKSLGSTPPFTFNKVLESFKRSFKSGVLCFLPAVMFLFDESLFKDAPNREEKKKEMILSFRDMLEDTIEYENEFRDK